MNDDYSRQTKVDGGCDEHRSDRETDEVAIVWLTAANNKTVGLCYSHQEGVVCEWVVVKLYS